MNETLHNSALAIRSASLNDYEAIESLFQQIHVHHLRILSDTFRVIDEPMRNVETVRRIVESSDEDILVAECRDRIVGLLHIKATSPPADQPVFQPKPFAMIEALVVAEDYQHKGVGATLLAEAMLWAKGRDLDSIQLMVWEKNASAVAFYEKHGFSTQMRRMKIKV